MDRQGLTTLLKTEHQKHKSYGYHRLAAVIRKDTGWVFSDHLVHVCAKAAGIKSEAKHYQIRKTGEESLLYPNQIQGWWNAKGPLEIVVSDMTELRNKGRRYEWTYILDTFNNEIIASALTPNHGDPRPYFQCLEQLKPK